MPVKTRLRKRGRAVEMLADGTRTYAQVAEALGVVVRTVERWARDPAVGVEIDAAKAAIRAAIRAEGIASRQNRIDALGERWELMRAVIAARAAADGRRADTGLRDDRDDLAAYTAAGAETGLMVHTVTYLRDGRREEWAVDGALLKELREHEKQAAQEMGQWTEKRELTGKDGGPVEHRVSRGDVDPAILAAERAYLAALAEPAAVGGEPSDGGESVGGTPAI